MTSTSSLLSIEAAVANTKMTKDTQSGTVSPVSTTSTTESSFSTTSTTESSLSTTSTTESSISPSRRSGRQTKSTITYINGQPVKKSNNYAVKGTVYKFEEEGDDVNPVVKKRALDIATNGNKKYKVAASIPRITPPHEIQRKAHNNGIRASKDIKQNLRQSFLKDHVEILKPFLEDSVYENLVNFQPAKENSVVAAEVTQPKLITGGKLRDYQIDGLKFMVGHYRQNLGTILGDEMGLGKTVQTISLFCYLKEKEGKRGPSLVVCPLSVLSSWTKELAFWAPSLKVLRLHNSGKSEKDRKILAENGTNYDVILTTYEMLKVPYLSSFFSRTFFHYMVLDEGHKVKGHETLIAAAARRIHCENRLLLTGTPLQNNLVELWSLLELLYPDIFTTLKPFDESFNLNENHIDSNMLFQAQKLLDLFMLRRLKSRVEALLPPKLETRVYCPLSKMQVFWYRALLMKDSALLEKLDRDNEGDDDEEGISKSSRNVLSNLFMQLRKCSQHPYLFPGGEGPNPEETTVSDLVGASGKLSVLDSLLRSLCQKGHRVVLFSQFTMVLDLLEDYCGMRGWKFARFDGGTSRAKRSYLVNQFNVEHSPFFLFLMSTKSGGMGLNLQSADTCILFDSDWNPQNDLQAMARVHRIGQKKKVHVYRLISAHTVEERIVERAAKKLLLDKAVNHDSNETDASTDNNTLTGTGMGVKDMLRDIKFGAQAIFGGNTSFELPTLEEIDQITNRERKENDCVGKLKGGTEENGANFDTEKSFSATQIFGGKDYKEARKEQERKTLQDVPKSLKGIERLWREIEQIKGSKREVKKRIIMTDGYGSGYGGKGGQVPVLASNNYDLQSGESSVFGRELSHNQKKKAAVPTKSVKSFENSDVCQICHDGGRIMLCPICPVSLHLDCCSGLHRENDFSRCSHHGCTKCNKTGSEAGGMLYRCSVCPQSFCEDCVPSKARLLGKYERFEKLGYNTTKHSAYIHCGVECERFAKKEYGWKLESQLQVVPDALDLSSNFGANETDMEGLATNKSDQLGPRGASVAAKKKIKKIAGINSNEKQTAKVVAVSPEAGHAEMITEPHRPNARAQVGELIDLTADSP